MGGSRGSSSRSASPDRIDQFGRVIPKDRRRSRSRDRRPPRPPRNRSRDRFGRSGSRDRRLGGRRSRSRERPRRSRSRERLGSRHRSSSHISISSRHSNSRRRSRSRSRDRNHRSDPFLSRERPRSRERLHRSRSRSPRQRSPPRNAAASEDPELLKSRIFIGNLPVDKITKGELEAQFAIYGKIIGVSLHERGFGFIQFEKESDALQAVTDENGSLLKGKKLDIKMALEGRRGYGRGRRPSPQAESSEPGYPPPPRDGRGPPPAVRGASATRERSPLRADPYEDRYRDPYREPPAPPSARRDDPYYPPPDPYRRPPPPEDPYYDRYRDDPYRYPRRDPYAPDPYRDPYRDPYEAPPPPRKPLPIDCHIILTSSSLRSFGDFIERKVQGLSMFVNSSVIPEDKTVPQMIEEASKRGVLFAVVVNSQNEVHKSLTLNILHGTPQEHRNMPVEDAVTLIGRSYEQLQKSLREKEAPPPPAAPAPVARRSPPPFLPAGPDITYLLNLLADNRQLTIEEIDKVIGYLRQRKDKLLEAEGRLPQPDEGQSLYGGGGGGDRKDDAASLQKQQQELQAKILSILNGPGDSAAAPPGLGSLGGLHGKGVPPVSRPSMGNGQAGVSSINFDNPSVQKALDNLISSGPNLLKSISSAAPGSTQSQSIMSQGGMAREMGEMRRDPHMMAREGGYGGISSPPGQGMQTPHMQAPQRGMYGGGGMQIPPPRGPMAGARPPRF